MIPIASVTAPPTGQAAQTPALQPALPALVVPGPFWGPGGEPCCLVFLALPALAVL